MQAIDNALLRVAATASQDVPWLRATARILTELGGWKWLIPLTIGVVIWLLIRGQGRRAVALAAVTLSGRQVVEWLKTLLDRPRPTLFEHGVEVHSLSFPSGHAANAMIVYLAIALIAGPLFTRRRWPVASALSLAITIGLTRPLLAVHYPTDVLAGWAVGLGWTLTGVWLLDRWMQGGRLPGRPRSG